MPSDFEIVAKVNRNCNLPELTQITFYTMKRIAITEITPADKTSFLTEQRRHSVFLGNDLTRRFGNIKKARQFLAEANRFLNFKLHETNYLYAWIYGEYRRSWFYFTADMHVLAAELRKQEREILEKFRQIDKAMEFLVSRTGRPNGNYFAFKQFFLILEYLTDVVESLQEINSRRNYYAESHRLEIFRNHADRIREQLMNYGKAEKNKIKISERRPEGVFPPGWNEFYNPQ